MSNLYPWTVVADTEELKIRAHRSDTESHLFDSDAVSDVSASWRSPSCRTLVTRCRAATIEEAAEIARARFRGFRR